MKKQNDKEPDDLVAANISLDLIDENPDNSSVFNMDKIQELADGIEEEGFLGAINVLKKPDGRYEISSGHRRYRAMKKLGRETIPCIVSELPEDYERGLRLLSSNIRNRELGPMDWARAVKYYQDLRKKQKNDGDKNAYTGRLREDTAKFFGKPVTQIGRYEALNKLIPELQEMANDPIYPWVAIATASPLSPDDQKLLYEALQKQIQYALLRENKHIDQIPEDIKREIKQNTISGQRIRLEISRLKNIASDKFAKKPHSQNAYNTTYGGSTYEEYSYSDIEDTFDVDVYKDFEIEEIQDDRISASIDSLSKLIDSDSITDDKTKIRTYIQSLKAVIVALEKCL